MITSAQAEKMGTFAFFICDYVSILNCSSEYLEAGKDTVVAIFKQSLEKLTEFLNKCLS